MKGRSQYAISEEMEVTNMTTDRSLLEDMLSDENLNKAYLQVVKNSRGSKWYEIYGTQGLSERAWYQNQII